MNVLMTMFDEHRQSTLPTQLKKAILVPDNLLCQDFPSTHLPVRFIKEESMLDSEKYRSPTTRLLSHPADRQFYNKLD
jgi:hypothetical protein